MDSIVSSSDAFLEFVEHARSILSSSSDSPPPWSWTISRILKTCVAYSSGVTAAILLSDLFQAWNEQHKFLVSKKRVEMSNLAKRRKGRARLSNTVTIDSIYEKNFLSMSSVIEAVILDVFVLPGTNIYMLSLGDLWSSCSIDLYLHRRYYDLLECQILKKGREILLSGCCLRSAAEGSGHPRLLPTEYMVIVLDEDKDEDAMLLGAQFCSDSFSAISVDGFNSGVAYSFYARIQAIESLESFGDVKKKQITLIDGDGTQMKFLLWGEQVLLANFLSIGSMLALDRPFIAHIINKNNVVSQEVCLEYGSVTRLYLVPFVQQEEQVVLASTQMQSQRSRSLNKLDESQLLKVSQVALPLDSQGSVDLQNYPFQIHVMDLRDRMAGISLYGVVVDISKEKSSSGSVFYLKIEDTTGLIVANLHFTRSWSLGRLTSGHTIYISGLTCCMSTEKRLELLWFEKDAGSTLVNLSCLPALLNSSCLHKLSYLSDISERKNSSTHVCYVCISHIECHDVRLVRTHALCGYCAKERSDSMFYCSFCSCRCDGELMDCFQLKLTLEDDRGKIFAWCSGQTAIEFLQICPDEFFNLPEVEQGMYLCSLENEKFTVAIVNCKRTSDHSNFGPTLQDYPDFEVTRAQKCE